MITLIIGKYPPLPNSPGGSSCFVLCAILVVLHHNPDTVVETCEDIGDNSLILCETIDRVVLSDFLLVTFIIIFIFAINF